MHWGSRDVKDPLYCFKIIKCPGRSLFCLVVCSFSYDHTAIALQATAHGLYSTVNRLQANWDCCFLFRTWFYLKKKALQMFSAAHLFCIEEQKARLKNHTRAEYNDSISVCACNILISFPKHIHYMYWMLFIWICKKLIVGSCSRSQRLISVCPDLRTVPAVKLWHTTRRILNIPS